MHNKCFIFTNMESNLVFFDTFTHESGTSQLDLVQFQLPVQVSEIRVIPLGARIQADFPGGVRLGATNPSQFEVEFFINDLSKRGAATFESIGCLLYSQQGDIKMDFNKNLPTDGLLLRGKYNTITLAVYGKLAKVYQDQAAKSQSDPPQPPPEKVNTHERIRDWLENTKVPRSPDRPWDESVQGKIDKDRRKEKRKSASREIDKIRGSHERTSHSREKSWEMSDKESYRKGKKDAMGKEVERELSNDRETIKNKTLDGIDKDRTRDILDKEWESDIVRDKDMDYDKELRNNRESYDDKFGFLKKRKIIDEWENHSETSGNSMRRPRTPQEVDKTLSDPRIARSPYLCSEDVQRKEWDSESMDKDWNRGKNVDSFGNWSRSRSRDKDRGRSTPKSPDDMPILPSILSDEMEAISDDEELLNLPLEGTDGDYPAEENMEGSGNDENEPFEYEDIMSEEEEISVYQYEDEYVVEEWENYVKQLTTQELIDVQDLKHFPPPSFTRYEAQLYLYNEATEKEILNSENYALASKLVTLTKDTEFPSYLSDGIKDPEVTGDMSLIEKGETWVQAVEYASQLLPGALVHVENKQETLEILYNWVENGINFDMAMNQKQPLYKIRHIKAGVKLALSLFQCTGRIAVDLMKQGIFDKLLELFGKEYMAISLKLLILRAIDAMIVNIEGIRFITDKSCGRSGYETILDLFSASQQSRVKVSISSIVRKIHFLEVCEKFYDDVTSLGTHLKMKFEQIEEQKADSLKVIKTSELSPTILTSIESSMKEILRCYVFADQLMIQSVRLLPGKKPFQLPKCDYDPYPQIYKMLNETKIFEAISLLIASSQLIKDAAILKVIKTFIEYMLGIEHGIIYLAWKGQISSAIIKSLLQFEKDDREYGCDSILQHLGWKLAYGIQIVKHFDALKNIAKFDELKLIDCDQACVQLNALHSIFLTTVGKEMLLQSLTLPKFASILFPFLKIEPNSDLEDQPDVGACYGYAVELLVSSIKLNPTGSFLESCSSSLIELINNNENGKIEDCTKLRSLLPYLSVAKVENFSYDNLSSLISTVQESIEKLEKFPGELFCSLQILCHLTIPKKSLVNIASHHCCDDLVEELRFKYATIQLFSGDLHTQLINLLSKVCAIYGQTFLHGSNFTTAEGKMVLLLIQPAIYLLNNLLSSVIEARNTEFKDLTAIGPLLRTNLLLDCFPHSSPYYHEAQTTKGHIISIILLFTQPVYTTEGEEVLAKSLWTLMMTEVFKMLLSSPNHIVGMVNLVIKLLPLPLPIQSYFELTEEENLQAVRLRKLWSAHLYILSGTLHDIIVRLGIASSPNLTHSLRKMCVAVADLSAPMALLVARSILDLVIQSHRLDQKNATRDGHSTQTVRVLSMLGSMVSHAPIKTAVIHLLRGGGASLAITKIKTEEKYHSLVEIWSNLLSSTSSSPIYIELQNTLLIFIYNLFDHDISMSSYLQTDFSGVPSKDLLIPLLDAVVEALRTSISVDTVTITLSILRLLVDHNYGLYYVKNTMDKKKGCFLPLLNMICCKISTDLEESFYLLQNMISLCDDMLNRFEHRTYFISATDLGSYLGWKVSLEDINLPNISVDIDLLTGGDCEKNEKGFNFNQLEVVLLSMDEVSLKNLHPFLILLKLIMESSQEDEISEYLIEDIKCIIGLMESESLNSESTNLECIDHTIESLQTQFASRITWVIPTWGADPSTWFLPPIMDNIDQSEKVKVNLLDICRKYTEDYDLNGALFKCAKGLAFQSLSPQKISKIVPKYKPSSSAIRPDRRGKPYVAPMRGRNFGRGNIRSDPFRSRPPNTSRPPSLHVDDFVALESTGHQPTGPTGYNKISFGRGKMMLDSMRGRGRQRGMNDSRGNRFFHRTPFRGMRSRSQGWGYRGDGRGSYRGSNHFMRGRGSSGSYRGRSMSGNSKERFSSKYMDRGRRKYM